MIPSLVIGAFLWLTALGVIAGTAWEWWRDRQRHKRDFAVLKSREEYVGRKYR